MALTDTPTEPATQAPIDAAVAGIESAFGSSDHKTTGRLFVGAGAAMFLAGAIVALVASIEHLDLGGFTVVDGQTDFSQLWSLGRDLLLVGGVVPVMIGLAIYLVPLQVGAASLAFPRGAGAAFWTWLFGMALLVASYPANGGPGGGRQDATELWALALGLVLFGLIWALICIAATVLGARAAGMDLEMVPVSAWSFLVFSLVGIATLPIVIAQLVLAYLDVKYGHLADGESRVALVSILDTMTLPPAVYWSGIPALGIGLEAIGVHTGKPLRFHRTVLGMLGLLGILAFGADIFSFGARGRVQAFDNGLLVVALIVAVLPVLASVALASESLKAGKAKIATPLIAGLGAAVLLLAATAGALLAVVWPIVRFIEVQGDTSVGINDAFDLANTSFHDGIFALGLGAALLGVVAGVHHWGHKLWGRALDDRAGMVTTLAGLVGALVWGVGNIASGFAGQPRLPLVDAAAGSSIEGMNVVSTIGIALMAVAGLLVVLSVLRAAAGSGPANEPWRGVTLEWATTSPPPSSNFAGPVTVTSSTPLIEGFTILGADDAAGAASDDDSTEENA